jgi:hypothetical protein
MSGSAAGAASRKGSHVSRPARPRLDVLTQAECEIVLARNNVGRLAFSFHDRVDIEPIHYVFADGWLYGRTSPGSKLVPIGHNHWIAFEVDEIDGVFTWRSVVVHGAFYPLSPEGPEREAEAWERAIDLLRRVIPETWTSSDPVSFRTVVFRIHIDSMTGRVAGWSSLEDKP